MNDTGPTPRSAPSAIVRTPSPLTATRIGLEIADLLATITLEQQYANQESEAIEVAYTIALPLDAVLLDVEVEIAGRRLRGVVQARQEAEMRYEQALAEGHSAFSIRMVDDQLLNIALGNLKPGERLSLRIVMAQWLTWNGDRVRLTLPTTIAPRYGASTLQPVDRPQINVLAEHVFRLDGRVRGLLGRAELKSATHRLAVRAADGGIDFSIERGQLDCDIVIDLADASAGNRIAGACGPDLPGRQAAMITFCAHAQPAVTRPVVAELVIDCSGSMAGVSMEQTRVAVRSIVGQLTRIDRVNVLRFGFGQEFLLRRPQPATMPVQHTILEGADALQADLGGTELLAALVAGLDDLARVPASIVGERVLFVISDGEVWNLDTAEFLERCAREQVRVFAVAVGSAAVEATFAPLTRATGGALERVLPSDAMAERIGRHFARVRSGALRELQVRWPGATAWTQGPSELFPGDGAIFSAGLIESEVTRDGAAPGRVAQVRWLDPDGERRAVDVPIVAQATAESPSGLARMLARIRLAALRDAGEATRLAVDYQLITLHTAITLVLERAADEQLDRLPRLRVVEHMLAAGWGGSSAHAAGAAAPPPGQADAPMVCSAPEMDIDFCLDLDEDLGAPPPAPVIPAPAAPARHTLLQPASTRAGAFPAPVGAKARDGAHIQESVAAFAPADRLREQLIALLCARFQAQPVLVAALRQGVLSLSELDLELSPALFNWLDARAEALGLDLESGAFWTALVDEFCAGPDGAALRVLTSPTAQSASRLP